MRSSAWSLFKHTVLYVKLYQALDVYAYAHTYEPAILVMILGKFCAVVKFSEEVYQSLYSTLSAAFKIHCR